MQNRALVDLAGKAAVVTGGADGLGLAAGELMARLGARVLLVDVDGERMNAAVERLTAEGLDVAGHLANVADEAEARGYVDMAMARFGRIDAFFNNAGILGGYGPVWEYPVDSFDRVIAVNVRGVFLGLRYVMPIMIAQGGGAIVNTASMGAAGGIPGTVAYVASKHAVIGLTKTAAIEAAEKNVRVNAVLPGNIDTKMGRGGRTVSEADSQRLVALVPQGRLGDPSEIAQAVCFLVSDSARHITGIELPVDGGILAASYGNSMKLMTRKAD